MAGLDDFFMQIAAKKRSTPDNPKADELYRLEHFGGIPESEMQPDPSNPFYQGWLRNGSTLYHATPQYPHPAFPWTQISPKIDSHSNMPTVTPDDLSDQRDAAQIRGGAPLSYDELGNAYLGLTPDDALRNYVAPPGSYVSYNSPLPGKPPMAPQPGLPSQQDGPGFFQWLLNTMRGG